MSIKPCKLYPPQPSTVRAQSLHLSYDPVNDRIAYPNGKSIIVRPLDPKNTAVGAKQFTKHIHTTTAATFAPSGNYVASGDESGQVKIWDSAVVGGSTDGTESAFEQPYIKSEFQILSGPIKDIAWDADNSRIIAVGQGKDKFGHCFTWDSGNSIGEIQGHSSTINAVAIKPQRPYRAATVSDDKALVFFNGPPFKFDKSIRGNHTNTIRDVSFSPDGKWLVSVGSDRLIALYDGKTGEFVKKIENAHEGGIFGVNWFKDSSKFVTCSADNTVKSWDVESAKSVETYVVDSSVTVDNQQVGVIVANDYIVSLSFNGNLNYFKENDTNLAFVLSGNQQPLTSVNYKSESELLFTGGSDGSIYQREVDEKDKSILSPIPSAVGDSKTKHSNYVVDIVSSGKEELITSGWDDTLKIWNDKDLATTIPLESGQPKQVLQVTESTVIVLFESNIELYSKTSGSLKKVTAVDLEFSASSISLVPSTDKLLVTNLTTNTVEEYIVDSNSIVKLSTNFPQGRAPPTLVRVSPDGKYAAVADSSGKYTVYNANDRSVVTTRWAFHSSKVLDAKWTTDSKFIISVGLDSGIFIYSVDKPSKVLKFPLAHQNGVSGVEWTSYEFNDKKSASFITTGLDGVIKTWNVDLSVY